MSIKLSDFKANVKDVARPNRFLCQFMNEGWRDEMKFFVKSTSLPNRTIGDIELNWQGMKAKIAGDPTFDDITLTFLNSYDFNLKNYIEKWIEQIATMSSNVRTAQADYKTEIKLTHIGRTAEEVLAEYVLIGAYPKSMDAIELSHESADTPEEFSVTFSIDYFSRSDNSGISYEV